jgi:hypothetical protein
MLDAFLPVNDFHLAQKIFIFGSFMKKLAALIALCLLPLNGKADFVSGTELQLLSLAAARAELPSHSEKDTVEALHFNYYIQGVLDAYVDSGAVCFPEDGTGRAGLSYSWFLS